MFFNGAGNHGDHDKGVRMDQAAGPGNNENPFKAALFAENWCGGTGKTVGAQAIMILVIELNGALSFQADAYRRSADVFFRPAVSGGAVSFGKDDLYRLTAGKVQDIAVTTDIGDHEVFG